ncbi:hypothetical protein [Paraburkholderia youngii]
MKADGASSIDLLRALKTFTATVDLANFSAVGRQLGSHPAQ